MQLRENIQMALASIKGQLLRTVLTVLIIALGITSLVGTLTCVDVLKASLVDNFTSLGANTFTIRNRGAVVRIAQRGKKPKMYRKITYQEAMRFKNQFDYPSTVSVSTVASMEATVSFGAEKTNPNIRIFGTDENYLITSGYEIEKGRNFSRSETYQGDPVIVLGHDLVLTLFRKNENPINQLVYIAGSGRYRVIGTLKIKGSGSAFGGDKVALIPIANSRNYFYWEGTSFTINILARTAKEMETTIGEAISAFRVVRGLKVKEDDNFEITKSDTVAQSMIEDIRFVSLGATLIGIITLFGAAIGLMNIMLVSVTERTREVGIRKSLGATRNVIRNQFLAEAIMICQLGGMLGILLALIIGLSLSIGLNSAFVMPWGWIGGGIILCFAVGLLSGLYPAQKAARLDPIEALRYE